jgi:RNA polymerase sigma-70 factor (sigma-E family)
VREERGAVEPDREEQFRGFVLAHRRSLLRTAWLLTGDPRLAEDLVQTALLSAYRRWARVSTSGDPAAQVRRLLVTDATSRWRRLLRTEQVIGSAPDRDAELLRALHALPLPLRAVVVLRFSEDLSEEETARWLGCSVAAVADRTEQALALLGDLLPPLAQGVGPR